MNMRLLRYTLILIALPLGGMALVLLFDVPMLQLAVMLLTVLAQLPVILMCRSAFRPLIEPDLRLLQRMRVAYVPIAYEPGRFSADTKVASVAMWFTALPPVFAYLAVQFPRQAVWGLSRSVLEVPSTGFLLIGILVMVLGGVAFPFWFQAARAAVIYGAGSEQKRYLLRGFVDRMEEKGAVSDYIRAVRKESM